MSDELERRLAALRPAELPADLQTRLATPPPARGKIRWLWVAAPLAAAAVWMLMPALPHLPVSARPKLQAAQPSDFHVYLPIRKTSTLVNVEDLAVIDTEPTHPIRLVRATWIDDVTYAGDDGHSTISHRTPRAQIIPITLETY
ncbi:hypothetical protein CfE428DRAFT_3572 [Chthoniobacter flavus Ellin428]|uniref:Uncharacterized protein n=1 Tax=Chthoniobacter flavus Ellin428 TaxID=497964 RepID=B4D3T4_9BACT|nr:hypothetical protein [Chthoniobacter flavus]EDY18914.1 hypothetical protein CfE428DRAFT_3572 [Chthoniobacter flavus Ellin428]TCO93502.1 hypothetical protein EV701_104206 [Chthoniobacter flavus]